MEEASRVATIASMAVYICVVGLNPTILVERRPTGTIRMTERHVITTQSRGYRVMALRHDPLLT